MRRVVESPGAENGQAPQQPQGPPWAYVEAAALMAELRLQIAAQAQEMAAMRVYIDQLHQALAAVAEGSPDAGLVPPGDS